MDPGKNYEILPGPSRDHQAGFKYHLGKFVRRKVPILQWLPNYQLRFLLPDIIAGFTVWMTAIPASMGDAAIAGVSPEYGLYAAYIGAFIYVILGSCRELVIGPQAVISLISYQACSNENPECVILLGFYSGVVHLIMGVLHLGFLVSFIPEPVTVGFTAGAAILIATGSFTGFLGLKQKASGTNVITMWDKIIDQISDTRWQDSLLGVSTVIVLIALQKLEHVKSLSKWKRQLRLLSLSRNALIMVISVLVGFLIYDEGNADPPLLLTGTVRNGFPPVELTEFRLFHPDDLVRNGTAMPDESLRMSFGETIKFLGTAPVVMALIEILQNVAITKRFADGSKQIDATQEMLALSAVNMVGSGFFSAIPTCASFSRSGVNASSGVKSHFSGLVAGLLMVMSLGLFTSTFKYIPKASLASIIIAALTHMVDFEKLRKIWRTSKLEFAISMFTLLGAILLGMEYGILVGVGLSFALLLFRTLRPPISGEYRVDKKSQIPYLFVKTDQGLTFPSVDHLRDKIIYLLKTPKKPNASSALVQYDPSIVVLDCTLWTRWDFTSVSAILGISDSLRQREKTILYYNMDQEWERVLTFSGLKNLRICRNEDELTQAIHELNAKAVKYRSISVIQRQVESIQETNNLDVPYGVTVP